MSDENHIERNPDKHIGPSPMIILSIWSITTSIHHKNHLRGGPEEAKRKTKMHTLPSDVVTPPENVAQTTASQPPLSPSKTTIIGLSGPSSSGKTTLGRLLRSIFNVVVVVGPEGAGTGQQSEDEQNKREYRLSLFILHQDDFYKTDKE